MRIRLPRRCAYALLGMALALGAPGGLLLVRRLLGQRVPFPHEIAGDPVTYGYVTLSTLVVFGLFGYALGRRADRLLELARRDPLTGLFNIRVLQERLAGEFARALRYRSPLSLLLLDLDGLKQVNDRHGHRAGDEALRGVAAAVSLGARTTDLGVRYGGDEFALLAPNTPRSAALVLAERIRGLVSRAAIAGGAPVTASVGVVTLDPDAPPESALSLLTAADQALYAAKRAGRNRVAEGRLRPAQAVRRA